MNRTRRLNSLKHWASTIRWSKTRARRPNKRRTSSTDTRRRLELLRVSATRLKRLLTTRRLWLPATSRSTISSRMLEKHNSSQTKREKLLSRQPSIRSLLRLRRMILSLKRNSLHSRGLRTSQNWKRLWKKLSLTPNWPIPRPTLRARKLSKPMLTSSSMQFLREKSKWRMRNRRKLKHTSPKRPRSRL